MKFQYGAILLAGLAVAAPSSNLAERQVTTPAPGSPESFAQASSIIGQLAKGLQGIKGIPFGADSASALQGLADGLANAGKASGGAAKRQVTTPAPGSPESFAQTSAILSGLAKGLQGIKGVPFGADASSALQGLADGLGKAGQSAKGGAQKRQVSAPGSPASFAQASAILEGLAKGLKGSTSIPFGQTASGSLSGIADGLAKAGQSAGSA